MMKCEVETCEKPPRSRNARWCNPHYMRWWATGDPLPLPRPTFEEHFWERVDKTGTCWNWMAGKTAGGYGHVYRNGRAYYIHRMAYEMLVGSIPEGLTLDHLCRNVACCNPDHLEPVTSVENVRRAKAAITHCPHGHPYSGDNLYIRPDRGTRECRACRRGVRRAPTAA